MHGYTVKLSHCFVAGFTATIAGLAGVPLPPSEHFDGLSLLPLLQAVLHDDSNSVAWAKDAAFSQYPKRLRAGYPAWEDNGIIHKDRSTFTHMGYSVRTAEWRLTEWVVFNGTTLRPEWRCNQPPPPAPLLLPPSSSPLAGVPTGAFPYNP